MKALFILSIVVPLGFLTTLRLTGILPEPTIETITPEAIEWRFKRPNQTVDIFDVVEASYSDSILRANPKIHIWDYVNRPLERSGPEINIVVELNSNITGENGFIDSVYIALDMDNQSCLGWLITDGISYDAENLSLTGYAGGHEGLRAYVSLKGADHPKSAYFSARAYWILRTPNSQTHQMTITYELTYFTGTTYKKMIQPFQLKFVGR